MIAITSLSPGHVNAERQKIAIKSWIRLGMKVYSFNHPEEISKIKSFYPAVHFVSTERTMEKTYGKPYVSISAILDWANDKPDEEFCLINSDIELDSDVRVLNRIKNYMDKNVVVCNRWDWDKTKKKSTQYIYGIDAFFLKGKHMKIFGPSLFCMGQCFWDYHVPYTALKNNIPVIAVQNKFAFHKTHNVQYSEDNWRKTGKQFIVEHDLKYDLESVGRMNEMTFNFLDLTMEKKTL